jgi:dihydrolipoyl dehydrogenase
MATGIKYGKGTFPWTASGRSLSFDRDAGLTKLLFDEASERVKGCGIARPNVGDLVAGAALAIGLASRPHPKLSETIGMAAEMFEGSINDLIPAKKRH